MLINIFVILVRITRYRMLILISFGYDMCFVIFRSFFGFALKSTISLQVFLL